MGRGGVVRGRGVGRGEGRMRSGGGWGIEHEGGME